MNRLCIIAAVIVGSLMAGGALADVMTYTGTGNWTDGGNWSTAQPGAADDAVIGSGANVTVNSDVGTVKNLYTGGGASKTMNMDGGTLELANSLINAFWYDFSLNLSNSATFDHVSGAHNVFLAGGGVSIDVDDSSFTMTSGMQQHTANGNFSITIRNGATFSIPSYQSYRGTTEFSVDGNGNTVSMTTFDGYDAGDGTHPITFNLTPGATGFDAMTVGTIDLSGTNDTLNVDVSSYNTNNGMDLVLFDYTSLTGGFEATNITGFAGTNAVLDYDYHIDGAGDFGIALCLDGTQIRWDSDAGDNNWQTAANWSRDFVPTATDDAYVGAGFIITNAEPTFASLETEAGSSVTFNGQFFTDVDLTVRGTLSTLDTVFRLYGSTTVDLYGTVSKAIALQGPITFHDGASQAGNVYLEPTGSPTVNFVLSETGFTMVTSGMLLLQTLWDNVTFNVDISAYDRSRGTTIDLMDFNSYWGGSSDTEANFVNATRNVTGHKGGTLSWDAANDRIVLEVVPITGTVIAVQ